MLGRHFGFHGPCCIILCCENDSRITRHSLVVVQDLSRGVSLSGLGFGHRPSVLVSRFSIGWGKASFFVVFLWCRLVQWTAARELLRVSTTARDATGGQGKGQRQGPPSTRPAAAAAAQEARRWEEGEERCSNPERERKLPAAAGSPEVQGWTGCGSPERGEHVVLSVVCECPDHSADWERLPYSWGYSLWSCLAHFTGELHPDSHLRDEHRY